MGAGATAALVVGLALIVGLRPPGGGKANASVATPATPSVETMQLTAVAPGTAPRDAPPSAAPAADDEPAPRRRHAVKTKRKSSIAHHGNRQQRHDDARPAKATRQRRVVAATATHNTPGAPAPRGDPRGPYERGNALLFAGDAAGAIAAYREAVRDAPMDPIGYRGLGLAYEQQGETAAALRALRKYLKLAPDATDRPHISRRIERLSKNGAAH